MTMRASRPAASSRSSIRRTPKSLVVRRKPKRPETGTPAVGLRPGDVPAEQPRAELRLGRTPDGPGPARAGREHPEPVRGAVEDPGLLNRERGKRGAGDLPLAEALSRRDPEPLEPGTARRAMREDGDEAVVERDGRGGARRPRRAARRHTCPDRGSRSCFPRRPRGDPPPPRERRRSRGSPGRLRSTRRSHARRRGPRRSRREDRADPRSRSRPGRQAQETRSPRWPGATRRRRARTRAPASRRRRAGSRSTRPLRLRMCASRPRPGGSSRPRSRAVP